MLPDLWVRAEVKRLLISLCSIHRQPGLVLMERAWYMSFFGQGCQWKNQQSVTDMEGVDDTEKSSGCECHYPCCHIPEQSILVQKVSLLRSRKELGTWPEQRLKYEASRQGVSHAQG